VVAEASRGGWWYPRRRDGGGGACGGGGGIEFFLLILKNVYSASTVLHDNVLFGLKNVCCALSLPHG
jgi:hypothetical protein